MAQGGQSRVAPAGPSGARVRRPTSTARFGSSRRESHDASAFYERFVAPEISDDETVVRPSQVDVIHHQDARCMAAVESDSIALVVTSPPYFAGKAYEESLGRNGVPGSYFEYLQLLRDVFAECKRVLEPGGRIAVNVANLGRRPYRSLAGDVTTILQDLGLLLRGEIVWWKGRAAGGSTAWGTFQRPANPVLRDVTERIVIASKGRFDRAGKPGDRAAAGLPSVATITREEFLEATTDLWELAPESATRVGHPAPFPAELPTRLITLYTYEGDVVLDPFMGSGSTAVAALRTGRHYVGFDTDADYVAQANARLAEERVRARSSGAASAVRIAAGEATTGARARPADLPAAVRMGRSASEVAALLLEASGFTDIRSGVKMPKLGLELDLVASDRHGGEWTFVVAGAFTSGDAGLRRSETLWRVLGQAAVLHQSESPRPLVVLTTKAPGPRSPRRVALDALRSSGAVVDVIELLDGEGHARLAALAGHGPRPT